MHVDYCVSGWLFKGNTQDVSALNSPAVPALHQVRVEIEGPTDSDELGWTGMTIVSELQSPIHLSQMHKNHICQIAQIHPDYLNTVPSLRPSKLHRFLAEAVYTK
jgi:hypothetical protein